jgi:thiamine biosynthesis protein ThiS
MKILLNNREEEFARDSMTVSEMLAERKFSFRMRIIKINNVFIPKNMYDSAEIHEGDNVQLLYLMSGG